MILRHFLRSFCLHAVLAAGSALLGATPATPGATEAPLDAQPVVADTPDAAEPVVSSTLPTLHLIGDSTLKSDAPARGWASEVGAFFDPAKINVVNHAIGGRSSKTFRHEGRWQKVVDALRPGDFVVAQFGHNDRFRFDDPAAKGRPSLHGEGEETGELVKPDGTVETVHTFGWYMRHYGTEAREKGATPIFCSMVPHKHWTGDGKIKLPYRDIHVTWTRNSAAASGAYFIDLNLIAAAELEKIGPGPEADRLFADKGTHTSPEGARLNARCFVAGLKALPDNPLAPYLNAEGRAVPAAEARLAIPPPADSVILGHIPR